MDTQINCSREYDPQICTTAAGEECEYDNPCMAGAAGQTNCVGKNDPVNPVECPAPSADTICTTEFDEKLCGENNCWYANQCEATAAGFTSVECRHPSCPKSTATMEQCGDFALEPLLCGPNKCPYLSKCTANRAGWRGPIECIEEVCPLPPPGTPCTLDYKPIVCATDNLAGGVPCAYSNACEAGQAGYNTSPGVGQCYEPVIPLRGTAKEMAVDDSDMQGDEDHDDEDHDHEEGEDHDDHDDEEANSEEAEESSAFATTMVMGAASAMMGLYLDRKSVV